MNKMKSQRFQIDKEQRFICQMKKTVVIFLLETVRKTLSDTLYSTFEGITAKHNQTLQVVQNTSNQDKNWYVDISLHAD